MGRRVVIIGGTGRMGRWFAKFLKDKDFEVAIHSRSPEKAAKTAQELGVKYIESIGAVRNADMVIVSTTLSSTAETIRRVSREMSHNSILFDIASVKGDIIRALEEAGIQGLRVISVHPMFGPGAKSLEGKHVIIIPIGDDPELVNEVSSLFKGAETHILTSGKAHDCIIALTLSLPHFLNIVFGKILKNEDVGDLIKFAGTTFMLQLLVTEAVYSEDPDLYYEIQNRNPAFKRVLNAFQDSAREATVIIKTKDREAFVETFKEVRTALAKDPNFTDAYVRFYKAYEAIA